MRNKKIVKELILFIVGMCLYMAIEIFYRGYTFRLMGIVGGFLLCIIDKINDKLSWDIPLLIQMIIGSIIVTIIELISGNFALYFLNVRMWDYSNLWLSMGNDFICPLFSLIWVFVSGIGIVLADAINYYLMHEDPQPYYRRLNGKILFYLSKRMCCESE